MAMFPTPESSLEEKMAGHKLWVRITIIASIVLGIISFGRSFDVIESAMTWFLIILAIVMDIIAFVMYSNYSSEAEGYAWQQRNSFVTKAEKAEKEAEEAIKNMNYYKRETEALKLKNAELTEKLEQAKKDVMNGQAERVQEYRNQIRSRDGIIDMYSRENDRLKEENENLKRKNASMQTELTKAKKENSTVKSSSKAKISVNAPDLEYNIDNIISTLTYEPVIRSEYMAHTPKTASLKRKYPLDEKTLNGDFTAIDLETTGLSPQNDKIIEISAVRFREFRAVRAFTTLVNPDTGEPLPKIITKITGIEDSDLTYQPTINEVFKGFYAFIGSDSLVGHNIKSFDIKFLQQEGFDIELYQRSYYDTLNMAKKIVDSDEVKDYKLETLLKKFGIVRSTAHRGESDSIASGILFAVLLSAAGDRGILDKIT